MKPLQFILQAIDPDYGHPSFESMFDVERPDELREILGIDAKTDPDFDRLYRLEPHEISALTRHFGLGFDPRGCETTLTRRKALRETPYLVHTGYELALMIDGRKQFARMHGDFYPPVRFEGEDQFDRYVAQGILHKEEELDKFDEPTQLKDGRIVEGIRVVYYTRRGEEWRIPAWKLISKAARTAGWNEHFERMEGMLFGYEDWQNDWWLDNVRRRGIRFGAVSLHLAVTEADLAAIDDAGGCALPLRTNPLELLGTIWEEADEDALRRLLKEDDLVAVVRFSVKACRFLDEVASDRHARLHALPAERTKDLNRLIVSDIEVVMRRDAAT